MASKNLDREGLRNLILDLKDKLGRQPTEALVTRPEPPPPSCTCDGKNPLVTQRGRFSLCEVHRPRIGRNPQNPDEVCPLCEGQGYRSHVDEDALWEQLEQAVREHGPLTRNAQGGFEGLPIAHRYMIPCSCQKESLRMGRMVDLLNAARIPLRFSESDLHSFLKIQIPTTGIPMGHGKESLHNRGEFLKLLQDQVEATLHFRDDSVKALQQGPSVDTKPFLVLLGPPGTGKTYMAVGALKSLMQITGKTGRFVDFNQLLNELRELYVRIHSDDSSGQTEGDILNPLRNVDILVIDELGKSRPDRPFQLEKLDDIVQHRYNNSKITIFTTNYLLNARQQADMIHKMRKGEDWSHTKLASEGNDSLQEYLAQRVGERIFDRLVECSVFVDFTTVPNHRLRLASEETLRQLVSHASHKR